MSRPPSADSILRNERKQRRSFEPKTPIATDMFLPNLSGDHSAGHTSTPVKDIDIANKKYVDDNALWSTDGTDVWRATGKVGIGVNPVTNFQIQDATTANAITQLMGESMFQYGALVKYGSTHATKANKFEIATSTPSNGDILLTPGGTGVVKDKTGVIQPVGAITMYGAAAAPTGWVNCDGASLLRAGTYAALFAVIGVTYGSADGTHFNVPDMRGAFPRGSGTSTQFTQDHATTLGTYEDDSFQGHWHDWNSASAIARPYYAAGAGSVRVAYVSTGVGTGSAAANTMVVSPTTDGSSGTPRTANETRPNNLGVNFIIKY